MTFPIGNTLLKKFCAASINNTYFGSLIFLNLIIFGYTIKNK